jgi:CRISPR/Cas system CMR subunit Cmr6 (Cas7 group RAMP superfamily)
LNIVCFRFRPAGVPESELDDINLRLGDAILADGRVYFGTTRFEGKVAFRPAIVNYRTSESDVDLLIEVVRDHRRPLRDSSGPPSDRRAPRLSCAPRRRATLRRLRPR